MLSFSDRRVLAAKIHAVIAVDADAYYELTVGGHVLRLTGEHPVATAPGVFRTASSLRPGDRVLIGGQEAVADGVVESVKRLPGKGSAYNLLVSPGGTYLANGIVVHNKGCFLPETLIRKEDGSEVPISSVRPKDRLLAFTTAGEAVIARVRSVVTCEADQYKVVMTRNIAVHVTAEHPFYVGNGTFKTLEAMKVGDRIFAFDGRGLWPSRSRALPRSTRRSSSIICKPMRRIRSSPTVFSFTIRVEGRGRRIPRGWRRIPRRIWIFRQSPAPFLLDILLRRFRCPDHHEPCQTEAGRERESRLRLQPFAGCEEERQDA